MLQKGFFNTKPFNPYPYWNGTVLFEQTTPGVYMYTFQHKVRCGVICVGGGAGGFCAKIGIKINEGLPDEMTFYALRAWSGGSGGYSYQEHTFNKGETAYIWVGSGGTALASTGVYGTVSQSNPTVSLYTEGTGSRIIVGSSLINSANPSGGGNFSFPNPWDISSIIIEPIYGGSGWTTNGNAGGYSVGQANASLNGGASVYNGYGVGGSAGYTGDASSGTPWANNGGNGYVKIYAIMPN